MRTAPARCAAARACAARRREWRPGASGRGARCGHRWRTRGPRCRRSRPAHSCGGGRRATFSPTLPRSSSVGSTVTIVIVSGTHASLRDMANVPRRIVGTCGVARTSTVATIWVSAEWRKMGRIGEHARWCHAPAPGASDDRSRLHHVQRLLAATSFASRSSADDRRLDARRDRSRGACEHVRRCARRPHARTWSAAEGRGACARGPPCIGASASRRGATRANPRAHPGDGAL
jgi:hypothetical protein